MSYTNITLHVIAVINGYMVLWSHQRLLVDVAIHLGDQ